jgi:hypothetical protein
MLVVKWQERETDDSSPSNAEIRDGWIYTRAPPYAFMGWCLIKHKEKSNLLFTLLFK